MPQRAGKRPGRRPGESRTREAILAAARAHFAARGWDAASVRGIARAAGVDPALVLHFFGSKEQLFVAATDWPFEPDEALARIASGPPSEMGLRLVSFFLSVWDDPARRQPVMGMLRAASTSPDAAALLRQTLAERLFAPLGERIEHRDAALRLSLCGAHLIGLGIARYIVALEPLASLSSEAVARLVAPALQRYLTDELGG
jgi:AcrR family transcriptional regulator